MSEVRKPAEDSRPRFKVSWVSWLALLAIIGVIVAVAIPSYGDYTHRAQASEAVMLLGGAKTPVSEYFVEFKKWPRSLDEVAGATSGRYTQSVAITKGAGGRGEIELTATMRAEGVDRRVARASIRLFSVDGGVTWTCRAGTAKQQILPAACRD